MAKIFFHRLKDYYLKVGEVLRGEASAAAIFPNSSDIGSTREHVYADFLKQHTPSKCNVFFGGFLFDEDGNESKQLDVIITTDTTPRFHLNNNEKSFSPVEGTLGVASIKSTLDKNQLLDALEGIASIPLTRPLGEATTLPIPNYPDWPLKIIYASNGLSVNTIKSHLEEFYINNPQIPLHRRPNIIHVAGQFVLFKAMPDLTLVREGKAGQYAPGRYFGFYGNHDLKAICYVLSRLQSRASESSRILFKYEWISNKLQNLED